MDVSNILRILNSKESFKLIADQVPLHVIVTDENGVIAYANKAAALMTGYSNKELVSSTPALWGNQMDEDFYKNMWDTIKNKKQTFTAIVDNKRKNGEMYKAAVKIVPIIAKSNLEENQELVGFVGIEKDLTEVYKLKDKYNIDEKEIEVLYESLFI